MRSRIKKNWSSVTAASSIRIAKMLHKYVGLHFGTFHGGRIGHFIDEGDLMTTAIANDQSRHHLIVMPADTCNEQVREMYLRLFSNFENVHLIDARRGYFFQKLGDWIALLTSIEYRNGGAHGFLSWPVQSVGLSSCGWYPNARPTLMFTKEEISRGWRQLKKLQLSPTDKIACLHVRSNSYLSRQQPGHDWSYHDYRNPPIEAYVPAVEYLLDHGFKVLRLGSGATQAFPLKRAGFIDYALSESQSDFLDVFLYSVASLAIAGGPSGLDHLALAFRCPLITTNAIPFQIQRYDTPISIVMPCLLRDLRTNTLLSLSQMAEYQFFRAQQYIDAQVGLEYNSAAEILDAVRECIECMQGADTVFQQDEDDLFWRWVEQCHFPSAPLPDGVSSHDQRRSRLSSSFLSEYRNLLLS